MRLGIIGAMDVEVATLRDKVAGKKVTAKAGMEFCEGTIGSTEVVVVKSGIGKVNAALCVQILVDDYHVTHVMNTGVAGSLNAEINIGDIVVSTDAMYHDVDVTIFGYQRGEVPQMGVASFKADETLRQLAVKAVHEAAQGVTAYEGRVVSGDQFIADRARNQEIGAAFHGQCCEMEGCAIAQAAYVNHIPFVIIRAISDKADGSASVDYPTFEAKAAADCANIVEYMVANI